MIRFAILALIVLLSVLYGELMCMEYRRQIENYRTIYRFIKSIVSEVNERKITMEKAIIFSKAYINSHDRRIALFAEKLLENLKSVGDIDRKYSLLCEELNRNNILSAQETMELSFLLYELSLNGKGNVNSGFLNDVEKHIEELKKNQKEKNRLYITMSSLSGIALVIVLI